MSLEAPDGKPAQRGEDERPGAKRGTRTEPYYAWPGSDIDELIELLDLSELHRRFLRARWLSRVLWMERAAIRNQVGYYALRLMAIIGGVIVPALVSLNVAGQAAAVVLWLTFGLSLLVAISAAVEEFFHFGERWRHYRRTVELLKIEGWQFFQLSGVYRRYRNHADAYPAFAARVEEATQREVEMYITEVVQEKEEQKAGAREP